MVGIGNKSKISNSSKISLDLKSGTHLGKYRLKKCLDTGGACEVWESRDSVEGIWVALKIPLAGIDGECDNKVLLREIRAVSRLRHPNILAVKNADIIADHAVLATELSMRTLADCSKPMSVKRWK
jgi:serine/threonine-protein kinase